MFHCSVCQIKTFQQLFNNLATDKQYYNQTNLYIVYNFHRTKLSYLESKIITGRIRSGQVRLRLLNNFYNLLLKRDAILGESFEHKETNKTRVILFKVGNKKLAKLK
jgi:hypothetical protein